MPIQVLVVDDHRAFRSVACAVVESSPGFAVAGEASSGEAAVSFVHNVRPGLVLMDINMPGMGGIEASRRIHAGVPSTVVVLLSTYDEEATPPGADDCGATRYVRKDKLGPEVLAEVRASCTGPSAD